MGTLPSSHSNRVWRVGFELSQSLGEGGVRVWELGELEEGREGPWIEVKPWGTLARCGRERGPDLSYRRPSSPLSRGQEIPSFPSRGKVDISPPSAWG